MSARFTVTHLFAEFLETVVVEATDGLLYLTCVECGEVICEVEHDDTLGLLLRTAMGHDAEEHEHIKPGLSLVEASDES